MKPLNRSMAVAMAPRPVYEAAAHTEPEPEAPRPEPSYAKPEPEAPRPVYEPPTHTEPEPEAPAYAQETAFRLEPLPAVQPQPGPAPMPEPAYAKPDPAPQSGPAYVPPAGAGSEPAPWPRPTFRSAPQAAPEPRPEQRFEPESEEPMKTRKQKRVEAREKKEAERRERREHRKGDPRRRLSILCGLCAAVAVAAVGVGAWQLSSALQIRDMFQGDLVRVAVAKANVEAGEVVEAGDVELALVPSRYVPEDSSDELDDVIGLRANSDLTAGVPIALTTLQASSEPASLATAPEEGKVAYMMSLGTAEAASPLLHVGDRVDVIVGGNGAAASVAVSSARVLALDGALEGSSEGYATVTIELTREQATALYDLVQVAGGVPHLAVVSTASGKAA